MKDTETKVKVVSPLYLITCLLSICFVVLKLTGFINWHWFFVTLGFWIVPAIKILIGIFLMFIVGLIACVIAYFDKK